MQTEIKEVGPCKLSVKIEIPKDKVKEKLTTKYNEFITGTVIPGFRKGRAPQDLVERKFGKAIKEDTKMDLISESYTDLIKEKKLSPAFEPVIEAEKINIDENTPLVFEFTMEVNPTIELTKEKYTGIKVKKAKVEVKEKDIKDALEKLQYSSREYIPAKEKAKIEKDDLVIIDQEMQVEGKALDKKENVELIIGAEINVFNKPSPEVVTALTGMKLKETKEIALTVPADYPKKELAGKPSVLKMTLKEHKKVKLPSIGDGWAKEMNFDSLEHLKKELEKRIRAERESQEERKAEEEIIGEILKAMNFAIPESLVERGAEYTMRRQEMLLHYQGMPEKDIVSELEKSKTNARDTVLKSLKAHYVIEHIARQEKLFVTEDEVTERINEIASQSRKWPHEVRAHYEKNDLMGQLRTDLREEKVRKFLREKAVLTD